VRGENAAINPERIDGGQGGGQGVGLMTGVASAQTTTTTTTDRATTAMMQDGQWRSSKLIGLDVYNDANERLGDIEELIIDKSGKIEHVVLGRWRLSRNG
jgi:PRC-barrel domain protein